MIHNPQMGQKVRKKLLQKAFYLFNIKDPPKPKGPFPSERGNNKVPVLLNKVKIENSGLV